MPTKNIMIVGVGGQGSLLASRILGNAVLIKGYDGKGVRGSRYEPARRLGRYICKIRR